MKRTIFFLVIILANVTYSQCVDCGNGIIDVGETSINCPSDIAHGATCISPCVQPGSFESAAGIRQAHDFIGTTIWSTAGLPAGWAFAGAPTATTAGALPAADGYGAKAGLIRPNCSGSCTGTNGFCIGNLANSSSVFAGGAGGKLGANFDGRPNVNQNLSYAVLRGQGNPTLVSETFNMSAVEGFKVQFWLFPSESSCGQANAWGSCTGNEAYLDFSSNGGASWTQVLRMNLSSTNSDMCTNNSTNTLWMNGSAWSRVCVTVFESSTSAGNFYTAASGTSAASGIMVNSAFFTSTFKFRVRYAQTASCTSGISATNPGRYLAIDYPVITSGDEMIPCGISFANMCGYGLDDNDDGVGSPSGTAQTTVFGTVRRSENQAERGVEIFNSQTSTFANQNASGSNFTTNFDLCNAEGGDKQCIDWQSNNNFYNVAYECITDWEAPSGTGINVGYYKGTSPQSFGLTKVTTAGKTATIGWRYSGSRFVSCGATSDLNPGCNGYLFRSASLPTQFSRGFYSLAVNSSGQSWSYYGASSCSNYFNGPYFSPIATPIDVSGVTNYVVCDGEDLVFTSDVNYCSSSAFSGSSTIDISGPGGFAETLNAGASGTTPITVAGDYTLTAHAPATPAQCLDCGRSICVTVSQLEIDNCLSTLAVELSNFSAQYANEAVFLNWATASEIQNDRFEVERSINGIDFTMLGSINSAGNSNQLQEYQMIDYSPPRGTTYYRLKIIDVNGIAKYSSIVSTNFGESNLKVIPNPNNGQFQVIGLNGLNSLEIIDVKGNVLQKIESDQSNAYFNMVHSPGIYFLKITNSNVTETLKFAVN